MFSPVTTAPVHHRMPPASFVVGNTPTAAAFRRGGLSPFAFRLSPFAFRLSPFAFRRCGLSPFDKPLYKAAGPPFLVPTPRTFLTIIDSDSLLPTLAHQRPSSIPHQRPSHVKAHRNVIKFKFIKVKFIKVNFLRVSEIQAPSSCLISNNPIDTSFIKVKAKVIFLQGLPSRSYSIKSFC
jgi:hypothetical protein